MNCNISTESLVLAMDTAAPVQSLAISRGNVILFEAAMRSQTQEGLGLLALVDAALKQCGISIHDIDRFAVSRGPGAFTGLRVSMAMLKSMALTLDRPLYAVSSLEAIARDAAPSHDIIASCIDARRGEIYAAFYESKAGTLSPLSDEMLMAPDNFADYIEKFFPDKNISCVGTAFPNYTKKLLELCPRICCRPSSPRAAVIAEMVIEKYPDSLPDIPIESLEPKYIRMDDFALPKPFDFTKPAQHRANK